MHEEDVNICNGCTILSKFPSIKEEYNKMMVSNLMKELEMTPALMREVGEVSEQYSEAMLSDMMDEVTLNEEDKDRIRKHLHIMFAIGFFFAYYVQNYCVSD